MDEYRPAKKRITVSVGESLRIIRELQELSQNQLSQLTGIPQTTISAIENDRVRLGVERAKVLARALKVHPGVIVFPGWELPAEATAQHCSCSRELNAAAEERVWHFSWYPGENRQNIKYGIGSIDFLDSNNVAASFLRVQSLGCQNLRKLFYY